MTHDGNLFSKETKREQGFGKMPRVQIRKLQIVAKKPVGPKVATEKVTIEEIRSAINKNKPLLGFTVDELKEILATKR